MRVYLSLLMFLATLLFSSVVIASDLSLPPTYCIKEPGPGLYLRLRDNGSLSAQLSLSGHDNGEYSMDGKAVGAGRFSFFLSPEFGTKQNLMSANTAAGMPAVDFVSGSQHGTDYGVQCGFSWKFK
jgi:hypothetical protein